MIKKIQIEDYLTNHIHIPIIDVRSPGEFKRGHIPHAKNIPLFSDNERAEVGTVYKQQSKEKAISVGYQFVTPKLEDFISKAKVISPKLTIAVHCWRGGMRSQSFAQHLSENGFDTVYLIEKGYKAYRNHVLTYFNQPFKLNVLGGYTGSGKTEILLHLKDQGYQVIDLEGIAHHKGSAFGSIGQKEQPTTEYFENCLFSQMQTMNNELGFWIEDESISIGRIYIPKPFFDQIRDQKVYFIEIPLQERAKFLVQNYGVHDIESLKESVIKIQKRLGPLQAKTALQALDNGDLLSVAKIALTYYDKSYAYGLKYRTKSEIIKIPMKQVDPAINANHLIQLSISSN